MFYLNIQSVDAKTNSKAVDKVVEESGEVSIVSVKALLLAVVLLKEEELFHRQLEVLALVEVLGVSRHSPWKNKSESSSDNVDDGEARHYAGVMRCSTSSSVTTTNMLRNTRAVSLTHLSRFPVIDFRSDVVATSLVSPFLLKVSCSKMIVARVVHFGEY